MFKLLLRLITIAALLTGLVQSLAAEVAGTQAEKKIMRITNQGFRPATMTMGKRDASVFFYNATGAAVEEFSIKFGKKRVHCHNPSMVLGDDGYLRASEALIENSFLIACFPESQSYAVSAKVNGKQMSATVIVPKASKGEQ